MYHDGWVELPEFAANADPVYGLDFSAPSMLSMPAKTIAFIAVKLLDGKYGARRMSNIHNQIPYTQMLSAIRQLANNEEQDTRTMSPLWKIYNGQGFLNRRKPDMESNFDNIGISLFRRNNDTDAPYYFAPRDSDNKRWMMTNDYTLRDPLGSDKNFGEAAETDLIKLISLHSSTTFHSAVSMNPQPPHMQGQPKASNSPPWDSSSN